MDLRRDLAVLALAGAALLLWGLGSRDFGEPDEPDFALISREMLRSGDWIVPTRNGVAYSEKPPLLYWMVAGLGKLTGTGVNGWTGRLPSAGCALMAVLAVYLAARRWLSRDAGFAAALILLTMPLWLLKGRWLLTDMPLAGFLAVALLGLGRGLLEEGAAPAWWGFVSLGLAVLSKGPMAIPLAAVTLAGAGILLGRNPFRDLPRWILGGVVALAVAAPWYLAVWKLAPPGFLEDCLGQNFRFVATASHARPWHYYLPAVLYDLFPWSLPALASVPLAWKARREKPALALALAWFLGMLLLLSASRVKQEKYLLPLLPAAALLAGWALTRGGGLLRWTGRVTWGILLILAAALGVAAWLCPVPEFRAPLAGLAVAAAVCSASARGPVTVLAAALAAFYLAAVCLAEPVVGRLKSARPFSEAAARMAGPGPLAYYGDDLQAAFPFYADRRVDYVETSPEALDRYLSTHSGALVMMRERDWERLGPVSAGLRVLLGAKVGQDGMVAVRRAQGAS